MLDKNLPNLQRDRIVLQLINRTDEDRTIDLFGMPKGINPSQDIRYGQLFETKYSEILIPIASFGVLKSWTINWIDENGSPQTFTFNSVEIGDLIGRINTETTEQFFYRTVGSNYKIIKGELETFFYFTPPDPIATGTKNSFTKPTASSIYGSNLTETVGSDKYYGTTLQGYWLACDTLSRLSFYLYNTGVPLVTIDANASYGISSAGSVAYDPFNKYLWLADVTASADVALIDLDIASTYITSLTPSSGLLNKGGYLSYSSKYKRMIQLGQLNNAVSSAMTVYDVETLSEVFSGRPVYNSVSINLGSAYQAVTYDNNGDAWIINGNQSSPLNEQGIFKFENDNWSTPTQAIFLDTIPTAYFKSAVIYVKGRLYVLASDTDTYLQVFTESGELVSSNVFTAKFKNFVYDSTFGNYILLSNKANSFQAVIDLDGNVVQLFDAVFDVDWAQYINGEVISLSSSSAITNKRYLASSSSAKIPAGAQESQTYTENNFTTLVNNTDIITYDWESYTVIDGSGISVTDTTGNIPYRDLVMQLRNNIEPYYFKNFSIYANTLEQANKVITKEVRGVAGWTNKMLNNPTIIPMQRQFVVLKEKIHFFPQTINKLQYPVKAHQTVTIIIDYTKGNLNAIAQVLDAYIKEGVSFGKSLRQLEYIVSEDEKRYLEETLRDVWTKRKEELADRGVVINVEDIFSEPKGLEIEKKVTESKLMGQIKNIIHQNKIKKMNIGNVSEKNIKRLVANYVAKGDADEFPNEYNYADGE